MKFLLYSINYAPELTGIGKYNGELVPALAQRDIETYVLTAPPYYPEWQVHDGYKNSWGSRQLGGASIYRCPLYVPKKVSTIKRLIHLSSFALSSALRL
ncbi:MAG: colanic acid biosynthesis glycosyltransferase WcaI, partial [Colwellia sp.]